MQDGCVELVDGGDTLRRLAPVSLRAGGEREVEVGELSIEVCGL